MKKLYHFLVTSYKLHVLNVSPHTSHLTPLTSYLTPLTSHRSPHTSYLIPLFAFCIFSAQAQPYQSIFGKEKTQFDIFRYGTCYDPDPGQLGCGETLPLRTTSEDTLSINGILYQYFNPNYGGYGEGYVREDTMTGRIYRYMPNSEEEFLICDMTLNVGDTFKLPVFGYYHWYSEEGCDIIVKQIDTIAGRKIIEFYNISNPSYSHFYPDENGWPHGVEAYYRSKNIYLKFIEGVGPIYGPLGYVNSLEPYLGVVLCVQRDDSLYYMTSELLGCFQFGVKINEFESQIINIYPNPTNDFIRIEISDEKTGGKLFIMNSIGMVVYQENLQKNPIKLNISHLPAGFYSILYETSKERSVSKFIKMK